MLFSERTYGYFCISISSVVPMGTSAKSISISISSVTPTGDLNKPKSAISTSMCISLLYEFGKNYDICYCIFVTIICLLKKSINACVYV